MCYVGDAAEVWRERTVTAHRRHRCDECSAAIPVGCRYVRISMLYEDEWSTLKIHFECRVLWGAVHLDLCEGEGLIMIGGLDEELSGYDDDNPEWDEDGETKLPTRAEPYRARLEAIRAKYAEALP